MPAAEGLTPDVGRGVEDLVEEFEVAAGDDGPGVVGGDPVQTAEAHGGALGGVVQEVGERGGPGGFAIFDRLIDEAPARLRTGGYLLVEIGAPQEQKARERIGQNSNYELAPTIHDYSGHPRVLKARRR